MHQVEGTLKTLISITVKLKEIETMKEETKPKKLEIILKKMKFQFSKFFQVNGVAVRRPQDWLLQILKRKTS